jgi:serine/threonine-protein kinase
MSEVQTTPAGGDDGGLGTAASWLPNGTVLGGVYRLDRPLGAGALGHLYRGVDVRTEVGVVVRVIEPSLAADHDLLERLKIQIDWASQLQHKNVAATYGMASDAGQTFVVAEFVDGQPLRQIIDRKRAAGTPFSLKGAYNIVAHLCNALGAVHETTFHGAVNPGNVLVNKAGRIKVAEFGYARALATVPGFEAFLGENGHWYLAPEMTKAGAEPDERADVYSIGVILYELLTLRSPGERFEKPSLVRPGLPLELDQVIDRCLAPKADDRFESIQLLKMAIMGAMEGVAEVPDEGRVASRSMPAVGAAPAAAAAVVHPDIDVDIDLDVPASPPGAAAGLPPAPPASADDDPLGLRGGDAFDIGSLVTESSGEEEDRYLISKGGLDFGPFAVSEIKRMIVSAEIQPTDQIVDSDSGRREKVIVHAVFKDFTEEVVKRREAQRRAVAEASTQTTEKAKSRVLLFSIVAAVGVVALAVGSVLIYQGVAKKKQGPSERKSDEISYQGSDEDPEAKDGMGGMSMGRGMRRSGGGSTGLDMEVGGYDSVDLASGDGGSETLSESVVIGVIDRRKNKIGQCMIAAGASSLTINVQVKGDGSLAYAGVRPAGAQACVRRAMAGLRFPTFKGRVTKATYQLSM